MARSWRRTPVCGITTAVSEKAEKRVYNRKLRHRVRDFLRRGAEILPHLREVSNRWWMEKDGRQRFDPEQHPDLMRK